jgi:putative FmdB family regulatory protein
MPTYQYSCSKCGEDLEVFQSFTDPPLKRHKGCGGSLQKVFAPVGIVLKGSGFYKTDNRSGSKTRTSEKTDGSGTEKKEPAKADSASGSSPGGNGSSGNGAKKSPEKGSGESAKPAKQSA